MNGLAWAAVLGLLPAAGAIAAMPNRAWVSWVVGAAGFVLSLYLAAVVGPWQWLILGTICLLACGYAGLSLRRSVSRQDSWMLQLEARKRQAKEMAARLAQLKEEGARGEQDQKKALAIYGIVKGLSEALDWETMRPKLEAAVQQQLGLEEFALYVSDMRFENTMHPLAKRRLVGSVGGSWDSLRSYLETHKLSLKEPHVLEAPQSALAVPIHHGAELVGYLFARLTAKSDAKSLLHRGKQLGDDIAFALKRVRLFQEVERLSELDGLTGVYRRAIWDQRLKEETLRAKTFKTGFSVLILDIDHFKRLNDTFGHPFGDQVLRKVGEVLRRSVYDTDFVARYGGEEFGVMLPRADPNGVASKAERIRANVEMETFAQGLEQVKITVSIGLAHFPRDGQSAEEVVAQADRALYKAKESGRNRVVDVAELEKGTA